MSSRLTLPKLHESFKVYVDMILKIGLRKNRVTETPTYRRYTTDANRQFFGYDQWALWLALVEIMWLHYLDWKHGYGCSPTRREVRDIFNKITTTKQDLEENSTRHDIIALLNLMRPLLSEQSIRYLHCGLTSYDTIETARSLTFLHFFHNCLMPDLNILDNLWREKISETARVIQMGRTHLQDALPITFGCWLAGIHSRFLRCVVDSRKSANELVGKISGAVGTGAALFGMKIIDSTQPHPSDEIYIADSRLNGLVAVEEEFLAIFGLERAPMSTQIVPPEYLVRHLFDLSLISTTLAQLGNDTRILQSSGYGEVLTAASSSSTMAHKLSNPITAENMAGMFTTIHGHLMTAYLNMVSDLQRDLTNSGPARIYCAVPGYLHQQVLNAIKLFKSMRVDETACQKNFRKNASLSMGEILMLALRKAGMQNEHKFVNKTVVPFAKQRRISLASAMNALCKEHAEIKTFWQLVDQEVVHILRYPKLYLGAAVEMALTESERSFESLA